MLLAIALFSSITAVSPVWRLCPAVALALCRQWLLRILSGWCGAGDEVVGVELIQRYIAQVERGLTSLGRRMEKVLAPRP
jgi:hypothetical protein